MTVNPARSFRTDGFVSMRNTKVYADGSVDAQATVYTASGFTLFVPALLREQAIRCQQMVFEAAENLKEGNVQEENLEGAELENC